MDHGNWLRHMGLLKKSVLFWKPKVPFFIFAYILPSHCLLQTVWSLLLRDWKSMLKSLFIRICSSAFVWDGCRDLWQVGGGEGIVIPLKYLLWKKNRTECKGNRGGRKKGAEKSCEQCSFISNKHILKSEKKEIKGYRLTPSFRVVLYLGVLKGLLHF